MADINRKPISTQISEKVTPDSQKTFGERVKENITGAIDHVKATLTPNSQKSVTQQATDKVHGTGHNR